MVMLNKIYTRTGDAGTTALGTGERVPKNALAHRRLRHGRRDQRQRSAWCACISATADPALDAKLLRIQNDLFDLGADLCVPDRGDKLEYEPLRMTDDQVDAARGRDRRDEHRAEAAAVVRASGRLAGGGGAAHGAHDLAAAPSARWWSSRPMPSEPVSAAALKYINRLSDFLFVASRYVNDRGKSDVLWVPGQNR